LDDKGDARDHPEVHEVLHQRLPHPEMNKDGVADQGAGANGEADQEPTPPTRSGQPSDKDGQVRSRGRKTYDH
jgi:hypothetical protein